MTRSMLKSLSLAAAIFVVPARVLAVWPPSTSLEAEAEASSTDAQTEKWMAKIEQDERRLAQVIQDLKDDEAALKKLPEESSAPHEGSHS
jgi:hypothetical protein